MITLPDQLPLDAPAIDFARGFAACGNVMMTNAYLERIDFTDDLVMELRELARWKCLHPWKIGRLKEPWKYRGQMELFT